MAYWASKFREHVHLGALKPNPTRPQLLLVEIGDISAKRVILKQAPKLHKSPTWSDIYISPNLTPKKRSHNKALRSELKARKDAGEKDIYIRCGKIVS